MNRDLFRSTLVVLLVVAVCACSPAPQCTTGMLPVDQFWYQRDSGTWVKDNRYQHYKCAQELHRSDL